MEAVIFIGLQASGKSTFFKERFFDTHVRINRDMLRTKHREKLLLQACIEAKQPFVNDKTNPTRDDRTIYIQQATTAGFRVVGYYFQSSIGDCKERNAKRSESAMVPERGLLGTYAKLERPSMEEGFDELFYVHIANNGCFVIEEWIDEV